MSKTQNQNGLEFDSYKQRYQMRPIDLPQQRLLH